MKKVPFANKPYLVPYESRSGLDIWDVSLKASAKHLGVPTRSLFMISRLVTIFRKAKVEPWIWKTWCPSVQNAIFRVVTGIPFENGRNCRNHALQCNAIFVVSRNHTRKATSSRTGTSHRWNQFDHQPRHPNENEVDIHRG